MRRTCFQMEEPLWIPKLEGGKEALNYEEFLQVFLRCIGLKAAGRVSEESRETGMVIVNSMALVETLIDSTRWVDMFPCIIVRTTTTDIISSGVAESTRNGTLQLMQAELQVLSPLVVIRKVNFLRFCKQHAEGIWTVIDVSVDDICGNSQTGSNSILGCRRLPSGCVVQDMPDGHSKSRKALFEDGR